MLSSFSAPKRYEREGGVGGGDGRSSFQHCPIGIANMRPRLHASVSPHSPPRIPCPLWIAELRRQR